jgi:hypothetical protein
MFDETLSFVAADIIAGEWPAQPISYRKGLFQWFGGDYGEAGLTGQVMRWRPSIVTGGGWGYMAVPQCHHGFILCPCWDPWDDLPL